MAPVLPWARLEAAFAAVEPWGPDAGRVTVQLGTRTQGVAVQVCAADPSGFVVRLQSAVAGEARALHALVLGLKVDQDDEGGVSGFPDPAVEPLPSGSALGRGFLTLLGHNDRLRGVHLQIEAGELVAVADLVCLTQPLDPERLIARIRHLAQVADGMEKRVAGADLR